VSRKPTPAPEWNSGSARRGRLAEQRASARLPRPGMEFRVCPPRRARRRNALQRGLRVSDSIPSQGGLADVTRFSVFGCVRLGIPSPAEAGSPNNALQRGLPRPGMEFRVCPPRRARRRNALQRVCLCQAGDSIPSRGGLPDATRFSAICLCQAGDSIPRLPAVPIPNRPGQ